MAPIGVWNQSSLHENAIVRSVAALPFLFLLAWCFLSTHGLGINTIIGPYLDSIVLSGSLRFGSTNIPILDKFLDIKVFDDFWRPVTVAFAPSTLGADPIGWYQTFSFLSDYSLLYCIWLFESARKANEWTPARFPVIFGLLAQIFGIGVVAPLYYFLHYVNTPLSRVTAPALRSIDPKSSRTIFLTLTLFSYLPLFLMFLGPSLSIRHLWTWAWQMFPVWLSFAQWIRTRIPSYTHTFSESGTKTSNNDRTIIRATISAFAALSASLWISTLLSSPYPLTTIFLPTPITDHAFIPLARRHFQLNHISALGSSLLWLTYLFADLKNADFLSQSWVFILSAGCAVAMCFGPGVAVAAGWWWREEVLGRQGGGGRVRGAGSGDERYGDVASWSLEGIWGRGGGGGGKGVMVL